MVSRVVLHDPASGVHPMLFPPTLRQGWRHSLSHRPGEVLFAKKFGWKKLSSLLPSLAGVSEWQDLNDKGRGLKVTVWITQKSACEHMASRQEPANVTHIDGMPLVLKTSLCTHPHTPFKFPLPSTI